MEVRERRQTESLREKWRAHYHNREFTPSKHNASSMGMAFYWLMVLSLLVEAQFVLVPRLYSENKGSWILATILVWFTLVESVLFWYFTWRDMANYVRGSTREKYLTAEEPTPPDWSNCPKCQVDVPPRSYHCNHCGKCILKRDHHCFFTGSCIGFYNQKYFVVFCLYTVWANLFAMFLQLSYLNEDLPILSGDIITYFPPVTLVKWILGHISFGQGFLVTHLYMCLFCCIMAGFFFLWQLLIISQGLTSHEAWKRILGYSGDNVKENVKSVFGSLVVIPFLLIFPLPIEQPGDGIQWTARHKRIKGN